MRATGWMIATLWLASCTEDDREVQVSSGVQAGTISVLRGTDRAGAFSNAEATTLANSYGVRWTGVYIGGACSAGAGWTKSRVTALANAVHWTFMPIYVGQQSSGICGAHTLTTARGNADGVDAANIMGTFGWDPHKKIPVALDVEGGAYNADPAGATNYVHGWVQAVHDAGYLAYVYSSSAAINHFGSGLGIDGVWVASYFYSGFASVTPADLSQIGSLFSNHNRAWQYAGDVPIPGIGGIDCNTSDLLLAPAPGGTNVDTPCAPVPADGRIVDDSETCFTPGGPAAYMRHVTNAGYGNSLYWTHATSAATEANFGEWSLDFAQAGSYHLEVYTAAAYGQSKRAKYVVTASGMTHEIAIDQTAVDGWQPLGEFGFAAGANQGLHLSDNTGELEANNVQLVFDAVRVTPTLPNMGGPDGGVGGDDASPDPDPGPPKLGGGCSAGDGAGLGTCALGLAIVLASRRRRR
jgi:hypothetical protein